MIDSAEPQAGILLSPRHVGETPDPVLVSRDLSKVYGKNKSTSAVQALRGVSLELARGQLTAIMGPSGSGKSTLLHCLAGLDQATGGSIQLEGQDLTKLKPRQLTKLRRDKIGFIFQSFNLVPTLTAKENITLPADIAGKKITADRLGTIVDAIGLSDRLTHLPSELSGGQQQRVACARALVNEPAVIFADEPTGNLDSRASMQILGHLRQAVDEFQQTVVMVTHDPQAAAWADRIIFLQDGMVVGELEDPTRQSVLDALKELGDRPVTARPGSPFQWIPRLPHLLQSAVTGESVSLDRDPEQAIELVPDPTSEVALPKTMQSDEPTQPEEVTETEETAFTTLTSDTTSDAAPLATVSTAAASSIGREDDLSLALEDALQIIAPAAPLPVEAARVVDHAQQILEGLPGSVVGEDYGDAARGEFADASEEK